MLLVLIRRRICHWSMKRVLVEGPHRKLVTVVSRCNIGTCVAESLDNCCVVRCFVVGKHAASTCRSYAFHRYVFFDAHRPASQRARLALACTLCRQSWLLEHVRQCIIRVVRTMRKCVGSFCGYAALVCVTRHAPRPPHACEANRSTLSVPQNSRQFLKWGWISLLLGARSDRSTRFSSSTARIWTNAPTTWHIPPAYNVTPLTHYVLSTTS